MPREYALITINDGKAETVSKSANFNEHDIQEKIELSNGYQLLISGKDELQEVNDQLKLQLKESEEANIAKETFLSNMSHDIRTPMNAIIGMTSIAKKHIDEKSRVVDSLDKIDIASSHLLVLINEVLDMSRINSGRMVISNDLFSISDMIHDTLTIAKPQALQKKHSFNVRIGPILYESLYGDALRLRQIFLNIINNSIKYTNDGGRLDIYFGQKPCTDDEIILIFRCTDNGMGMTPEFLDRLFTPFERANSTTISKIEGTGLGMSIVKKLIDNMNGVINVESELNKGTSITIEIPFKYEIIKLDTSALKGRKLLIVEADEELQETYRTYLGEYNIDNIIVDSYDKAIAAITDAEFNNTALDAVILGRTFEGYDNLFEAASYIHRNMNLPVILISEHDFSKIEYRAERSGIEYFIPVPFFRKSLLNGLNEALIKSEDTNNEGASADLTGKNILLVEDNMINRMIANEILKVTNASIENAENGQEAVDKYLASPDGYYSIILMDIQMPVLDGYGATKLIRASGRSDADSVKIFAMTANTFAEDIAKARNAGMNGHIAKPIDIRKLMHTLRSI